jgi:hypothetical protein
MTNREAWELYTRDLTCPQIYLDFGYVSMITAALQRRVWYNNRDKGALFPNTYIILVGEPAIGKGLVLSKVNGILKKHPWAEGAAVTVAGNRLELPRLIPGGANTTTFEGLLKDMTGATRSYRIKGEKPYIHASLAFALEELASLFKQNQSQIIKFLLEAYDCGDYDYKPKHGPQDLIRNMCLNFLACAQEGFLREATRLGIFDDGFTSRCIFVFAHERRFERFHQMGLDAAQEAACAQVEQRVLALTKLYGQLTYSKEVHDFLEDWYITKNVPAEKAASAKMRTYYGRKRVALLKLAAAMHFSESDSLEIPLHAFQSALELLDRNEAAMARGLNFSGRNEMSFYSRLLTRDITKETRVQGISEVELFTRYQADINMEEFYTIVRELLAINNDIERITPAGVPHLRKKQPTTAK